MTSSTERLAFDHYAVLLREDGTLWELGRGAMGVTYKAEDVNLHCPVALKVISADCFGDEQMRRRFVREARAAARLRHANVASVHHLGSDGEHYFYAMELVEGESMETLVQRSGPLPARAALQVAVQVARALGAAAREHLVHRDVKPANLMMVAQSEPDEAGPAVKLIDFGLARSAINDASSAQLTRGGFVGTPQFASPEQAEERELDSRSDIYSLGCTLWYLLAGLPPFRGSVARVFTQHLHGSPPFEELRHVPRPVVRLLGRMLRKDPAERPQDAAELRRELEHCLAALDRWEARAARLAAPLGRANQWRKTHRREVALAFAGLLAAAVIWLLIGSGVAPRAADQLTTWMRSGRVPENSYSANNPELETVSNLAPAESEMSDLPPIADGEPEQSDSAASQLPAAVTRPRLAGAIPDVEPSRSYVPPEPTQRARPQFEGAPAFPAEGPPAKSASRRPPPDARSAFTKMTDDARQFVRAYLNAAEKPQPSQEVALYADQVDYFTHGRLSRKAIEEDQRRYYRKWPTRNFELLGEPRIVEIKPGEVVIQFRMKYEVRNSSEATRGVTENTLRLKQITSGMRITAIRERKVEG